VTRWNGSGSQLPANGLLLLAALSASSLALAAPPLPQPDRQGDYYSNEAPVKGQAPPPLMAGSLWQVVALQLNCRRDPGLNQPIVRQFIQGDWLQAEVYRGGSDEVLLNALDGTGKPWMPVRGKTWRDRCFVRANHRFIQPVSTAPR
jgi:hypothetical protein